MNDYQCTCAAGWTDKNCSANIDDCTPNLCTNEGTCNVNYLQLIVLQYTFKNGVLFNIHLVNTIYSSDNAFQFKYRNYIEYDFIIYIYIYIYI